MIVFIAYKNDLVPSIIEKFSLDVLKRTLMTDKDHKRGTYVIRKVEIVPDDQFLIKTIPLTIEDTIIK